MRRQARRRNFGHNHCIVAQRLDCDAGRLASLRTDLLVRTNGKWRQTRLATDQQAGVSCLLSVFLPPSRSIALHDGDVGVDEDDVDEDDVDVAILVFYLARPPPPSSPSRHHRQVALYPSPRPLCVSRSYSLGSSS